MRKIIVLILVFVVFWIGCEKTIEFNGDKSDPVVVVNSIISPDSLLCVKVSKSVHITESTAFPKVTNANVDVYEQGNLVTTIVHKKNGYYSSDFLPLAGRDYEIKIATGETMLSAKTSVPVLVAIETIELQNDWNKDLNKDIEFSIRFKDPVDNKNYYMVSVLIKVDITINEKGEDKEYEYKYYPLIISNDPVLLATFGQDDSFNNSPDNEIGIFTDELINGKTYDLNLLVNGLNVEYQDEGISEEINVRGIMLVVKLNSISKEYFYYLKSKQMYHWYSSDPFSEPVPVYSNINNGVGIFGGYSTSVDSLLVIENNRN